MKKTANENLNDFFTKWREKEDRYDSKVSSCLTNIIMSKESVHEKDHKGVSQVMDRSKKIVEDNASFISECESSCRRPELCSELILEKISKTAKSKSTIKTATDHSTKEQFDTNLNAIIESASRLKSMNISEKDLNNMAWTIDKVSTSFDDLQEVEKHFNDNRPLSQEQIRKQLMWMENDNQYIEQREGVDQGVDLDGYERAMDDLRSKLNRN